MKVSDFFGSAKQPFFTRPEILGDPPIIRSLWGINPRTIMGNDQWKSLRDIAAEVNNHCCYVCGEDPIFQNNSANWLEGHERYDWELRTLKKRQTHYHLAVTISEVVALCSLCHNYIHRGGLQHRIDQGWENPKKLYAVTNWGNRIVRRHKVYPRYYPVEFEIGDIPLEAVYLEYGGVCYNTYAPEGFERYDFCSNCGQPRMIVKDDKCLGCSS